MSAPEAVTRLLIIDDSVRVRRAVARAALESGIEVVASMCNGRAAVTRSQRLGPDVVLLDAAAGEDGRCATLEELRRLRPSPRVIMRDELDDCDERQLAVRVLAAIRGGQAAAATPPRRRASRARPEPRPGPRSDHRASRPVDRTVRAVAIAASTGGPDALEAVLSALSCELPAPVFIVQHMPAGFTRMLAERLDRRARLSVAEAKAGADVHDGRAYVAPGDRHLALERGPAGARVVLHDGPPENSCRPAADVLFRSAAALYGSGLLALVLTGMGQDGLEGARAVRDAGGRVFAQSERSAVIASMPRAVAQAQLADEVFDLADLGPRVAALTTQGGAR